VTGITRTVLTFFLSLFAQVTFQKIRLSARDERRRTEQRVGKDVLRLPCSRYVTIRVNLEILLGLQSNETRESSDTRLWLATARNVFETK